MLDDAKHYWVSTAEVDKLIRAGGDWLAGHPARDLIVRRYVSHQRGLTRSALARLAEADDTEPEELDNAVSDDDEPRKPLATQRREAILAILRDQGARRIGDFGCGAGVLIRDLLAVFGFAAPATVIVTTPNAEYNPYFETLPAGALRHRDHRFEWTRAEFRAWANQVADTHRYQVRFLPVGPEHPDAGPPTQLAVFTRQAPP